MAATSTLLATQCAAGVAAAPRWLQIRRNLITTAHETTIMAANPALQYEAGVSVFTPCRLHRNAVSTKREKMIVAAYPTAVQVTSDGIPLETVGRIENISGGTISLEDKDIWQGSQDTEFPMTIANGQVRDFTNSGTSRGKILGSIGALKYKLSDGTKWIIAWSNPLFEHNKVYTDILDGPADWEKIKTNLEGGEQESAATSFQYCAELVIDPTSGKPTMQARIVRLPPA